MGGSCRSHRIVGACLAGFLLAATGLIAVPALGEPLGGGGGAGGASFLNASLGTRSTGVVINPEFWGADLRPTYILGTEATSTYGSTNLSAVRWPGGAIADRLNATANRIYNDNATYTTPPSNESDFVSWCRSVGCAAIIQLPGEIDSPSTAAYEVAYTEQTLHFTPLDWEIGNEPFQWTHFGTPWSQWSVHQAANATPSTYAQLVHAYIIAIRAVDPAARILGLPGVGDGAFGEAGWIRATVSLNGPNLSGVAIHVYPAGGAISGTPTLAGFYATLNGSSALPSRLAADRLAVAAGCPACRSIPVLATEIGSGTQGGGYNSFMTAFPDVPYIATEAIQALAANMSQIDLYAFQSTYGGSLLLPNGTASPIAVLYEQMLSRVRPVVTDLVQGPAGSGFIGIASRNANGSIGTVLVANTNLTRTFNLVSQDTASPRGFTSTVLTWNNSSSAPVRSTTGGGSIPILRVPPESVALLIVNASVRGVHLAGSHLAVTIPPGTSADAPAALLGLLVAAPILARRGLGRGRAG